MQLAGLIGDGMKGGFQNQRCQDLHFWQLGTKFENPISSCGFFSLTS
jgi:hypothetical protein